VSKEDHGATIEHVLRLGGAQRRWHARRPVVSSGGRGIRGGGQQGRGAGPGKGESDAWSPPEQEVERRWVVLAVGGRGEQRSRAGRQRRKKRGGSEGLVCKNRKSRDLTVK
jgi:hypothetical protein